MRGTAALLGTAVWLAAACSGQALNVRPYAEHCVDYYAWQYQVPPALVRAIIQVESAWQPGVVSPKGAMGLMQLMPATARQFGATHPFQIDENIRGGIAYLAELIRVFRGDLRLVTAAYAAGERPVLSYGLNYSSEKVYRYVYRVAQVYGAELRRERGR
jgi:soluble lytic murein transglycosylase-like protein